MRYTLTFLGANHQELVDHLRSSTDELAAFIHARVVVMGDEIRLLVRGIEPVAAADIETSSPVHLSIVSRAYVHSIKRSRIRECAFGFVHSHPRGPAAFSPQDDQEEPDLFRLAHSRNPQAVHFSLVAANDAASLIGRVWHPDGTTSPIDLVRVIGDYWDFTYADEAAAPRPFFARQVLALGSEIQNTLERLHVGVVGVGGTGSAVVEQLIRLGVGRITLIDPDHFDDSNVNRVYGSSTYDRGLPKVTIAARHSAHMGLGTQCVPVPGHAGKQSVARKLRECDVIFGCTDDQWGRSVLCRLAIYYLVPVIDMGVSIDPNDDGSIRSIHGRVTMLQPSYACLFCRERITPKGVRDESIRINDPERAKALAAEGYIAGVAAPAPAVIPFTSTVASTAIAEFIDRLVRYKSSDTKPSEFILRFEGDTIRRNTHPPTTDCFCNKNELWGAGDRKLFMGISWPQE
jgi:molybdopterin/thiamine biosynthesis adenylyltransferase